MRRQIIRHSFTAIMLILSLFSAVGEGKIHTDMNFYVELVSYDYFSHTETSDNGQEQIMLWLRFRIVPSHRNVTIDSFKVMMNTASEKALLQELPIPVPNKLGYYYQGMSIGVSNNDNDAITAMLRETTFQCEITARGIKGSCGFDYKCDVFSKNVQHETFKNNGDFLITVNQCVYHPIEFKQYFYLSYPGLEEYTQKNQGCSYYSIEFVGTASKKSPYFVLGIEYISKSSNVFLLRHGEIDGESSLADHSDMIDNGEKQISIVGVLCINEGSSIEQDIKNARIIALYSPEYAGHLDISDAGDRFDGPKVYVDVNMDHVDVITR